MGTTKRKPKEEQAACSTEDEPRNQRAEAGEDGFESLRAAADKQLGKHSGKIAEALGKKAADGDLNSAKFLVAVAEKKERKGARKKRRGLSVAERLALEPQWEEPAETDPRPDRESAEVPAEKTHPD
jgi:hypothetical protein